MWQPRRIPATTVRVVADGYKNNPSFVRSACEVMFPGLQWTLAVYKVAGTMPSKQKTKAIVCCASRLCTPGGGNVSMRRMVVRRPDIFVANC